MASDSKENHKKKQYFEKIFWREEVGSINSHFVKHLYLVQKEPACKKVL